MAEKAPAYQWYPKDYDTDEAVKLMTYEQEGIYRRLLDHQWLHGSIPADPQHIACLVRKVSLARFLKLWKDISGKFVDCEPGRLLNSRLERQRTVKSNFHEDKRAAGIASAAARREKFGTAQPKSVRTDAEQPVRDVFEQRHEQPPNSASASSSASASAKQEHVPREQPRGGEFDAFWAAYPRKTAKDAARKVWHKRSRDLPPIAQLLAALDRAVVSPQWAKDGGRFIPHPATWLNQGRWQDESEEPTLLAVSDTSRQNMANMPGALRLIAENEHARQR